MPTRNITHQDLLEAGVHFGHLKKKWNPKMAPFIFMEKKGIHILDLNKTLVKLNEAANAAKSIARSGKKILFVATKKQAREIVEQAALKTNMPFVTERWLGGMLTNFSTIRKSIKKMQTIDSMLSDTSFDGITKKERLRLDRERQKLEKVLRGIESLNRMPAAVYIVDITKESIALAEAMKLNISTIALVDTNADPTLIDFPIPANDDANKSIAIITGYIVDAIIEGLDERIKVRQEAEEELQHEEELTDAEKLIRREEELEALARQTKSKKAKIPLKVASSKEIRKGPPGKPKRQGV